MQRRLPVRWGTGQNIAWKVRLAGVGWSQPIVWGNKIFVTTAEAEHQTTPRRGESGPGFGLLRGVFSSGSLTGGAPPDVDYRWKLICLDGVSGHVLWQRLAHEGRPSIPIHRSNTYASETPVTDGQRVIAYFGMTGVYCFGMSGEIVWSKQLGSYPMQFGWGTGSSPVLFGQNVFLQCDNEKASFLVALDKQTGDERWRVERDERSNWSTPYIWRNRRRTELIAAGGNKMRSYDPDGGKLLWEMGGSGRCATTPVGDAEMLYVGSVNRLTGSSGLLAAVVAGAENDISLTGTDKANEWVAWSVARAAPPLASPLLYQGCLYLLAQRGGVIRCLDAKTGKQHYRQRLPGAAGFTASPWANDGKVYCLDEDGRTYVLLAGPQLTVIAINQLDEMFWASVAVIDESLLLRGVDHLYRVTAP